MTSTLLMGRRSAIAALSVGLTSAARISIGCAAVSTGRLRPSEPRVAALEWAGAETLAAIGVTPLAIPSPMRAEEPFNRQNDGIAELGSLFEPNLEVLAVLRPETILYGSWHTNIVSALERIAVSVLVDVVRASPSHYANARTLVLDLAKRLDREQQGRAFLDHATDKIFHARRTLAGVPHRPTFIGTFDQSGRLFDTYGPGHLVQETLNLLGFENAYQGAFGPLRTKRLSIDNLADVPDAQLVYIRRGYQTRLAISRLEKSQLWNSLPLVQSRRLYSIPYIYPFAGLPTAMRLAGNLAQLAGAMQRNA